MAYTAFPTWTVGQVSLASDWNTYVAANMQFLAVPPRAKVYRANAYSLTSGSQQVAPYDTVVVDTQSGYSVSTFLYTVAVAGAYLVIASWGITSGTTQQLNVYVAHNGTSEATMGQAVADIGSTNFNSLVAATVDCVVGDTLSGKYYGSASNTSTLGLVNSRMDIVKISN